MMEYPSFFEEHITQVIRRYNDARSQITNATSFVFITDVHIHLNGRASVPLIREIGEQTDVKTVLCGGDLCWAWGSKAECHFDFEASLVYLDPIRETMDLYMARGNHDATVRNSLKDDRGYTMSYEQVQRRFAAHTTPAKGAVEGKLYFYTDDPATRTRFVVLDTSEHHLSQEHGWGVLTGMELEQLQWFCDTALRLDEEDWSVVVMGHIPCAAQMRGSCAELQPLSEILEAFKNKTKCEYGDFRDAKAELIMYLCGHNHQDRDAVSGGVLHISTGCDAYCKDDGMDRPVGMVDNTLFDLFLVDQDKRTVQVFRIGAGKDRAFSY